MMSKEELEEVLEDLEKVKGSQTELISVYVPSGQNLNTVRKQMEEEKGTAENIKSKNTRKNVIAALETISRDLKNYKKTAENGMAFFCGNVSNSEGKSDIQLWVIEPPQPLNTRLYRCDKEFVLEPLKKMLESEEVYGLVVMDRKQATLGLLDGKHVGVIRKMTSGVPGKQRAGGQSSQRFERLTEGAAKKFYRRVAEAMKKAFFKRDRLKGIIIGGPVPTKEDFLKEGNLITALKDKVIGTRDLGYADEHGLDLLVEESQDLLEKQEIIHEKKLLEKFFDRIGKEENAVYKKKDVEKALKYGAVEVLILSKKLDKKLRKELSKKAENISASVEIVSNETDEGEQFWSMGGMGALLRFEV
jgi:peptide chain release factor subunit 1